MPDEWTELVRRLREYALRKYGREAVGLALHFEDGAQHYEPLPPRWLVEERQRSASRPP